MFKKILLALGIFFVPLIVLITVFSNWAKNPYGLEPERLGPKGSEELPAIIAVPNAKNYLLYSRYDDNSYVIHLPLPNEYIHSSNTSTRIHRSYSAHVTMYYPELNGKFHPDNAGLPKCNGWCGGHMAAVIKPDQQGASAINARRIELIQRDRLSDSPLRQFEDLESEFGLDDHFQIRYPVLEKKWNGEQYSTKEYLLKRNHSGAVKYLFECSPYAHSPGCSVKFNLSSDPEILVDIRFGRHHMTNWEDIIRASNKKITSWGLRRIETVAD